MQRVHVAQAQIVTIRIWRSRCVIQRRRRAAVGDRPTPLSRGRDNWSIQGRVRRTLSKIEGAQLVELADINQALQRASRSLLDEEGLICELEFFSNEAVVTANRAALFHIAARIIDLATKQTSGSHFTIDRADIAPEAVGSITIACR